MLRCWSADPSSRPAFSELTSSLDTMMESMADYMEVQMNLVPVEPEEEEGYEYVSPEGTSLSGGGVEPQGAKPETGGGESDDVYENAEEADEIPVHPNPVYGERGNEMEDIPVRPNPLYGEL